MSRENSFLARLLSNRTATWSAVSLVLLLLVLVVAPWTPWLPDPNVQHLDSALQGPGVRHWMGTDHLGRDMFARLVFGGRISLLVGLVATAVTLAIGVSWGAIAGYSEGKLDAAMMRTVDILFALPFLVLVILFSLRLEQPAREANDAISGILGIAPARISPYTSLVPLFLAIGALGWLTLARMVRSQVKVLRRLEYVDAARSLGLHPLRVFSRHMLPNLRGPVIVQTTLAIPGIMLLESLLSFLGLGVKPPDSSWGTLIKEGADRMEVAPWMLAFPASAFCLTLLALNFLGDGLRDVLDPRDP